MNLYVRADSDGAIGTGHIMRCIALAQAWQDRGGKATFLSHCASDSLRQRIIDEGFDFLAVENTPSDSSDSVYNVEMLERLRTQNSKHKTWFILDGYHFTTDYQKAIRNEGYRLLVIDDMNHLPYYCADILLNQNIYAPDLKYNCDKDTILLRGTRYILLRKEFLKYRHFKRQVPDRAKKILVTLGGADPDNVTLKVIEALKLLNKPDIAVRIVVGPANIHQDTLRISIASAHFEAELLCNPSNMPELLAWADLAISGGGSTCWELAFMGVPIMALILADNQKAVVEGISKEGFAVNLGWYRTFDEKVIGREINMLIQSKDRRLNMVHKGQELITGSGSDLICESILSRSISVEPAKESDCELIWRWANDQEVRNSAFCTDMILFEDHKKWFHSKINDPNTYQFVGYDVSNQTIGQVRFDIIRDREYDVDISIDKRFRNNGLGSELIKLAIHELLNVAAVDVIHSHVKISNYASKYLFLKAGFIPEKDTIIKNTACLHFVWKRNNK